MGMSNCRGKCRYCWTSFLNLYMPVWLVYSSGPGLIKFWISKVRRVQKYVETLDMLKIKNSTPISNGSTTNAANHISTEPLSPLKEQLRRMLSSEHVSSPVEQQQARHSVGLPMQQQQHQLQPSRHSASGPILITTQWETFDSIPVPTPMPAPPSSTASTSTLATAQPRFNWDLLWVRNRLINICTVWMVCF